MGERTPPKTNGFWISFRPNVTTVQKGPQRIASASTLAAAGVVGREHLRFYRFEQLSNRALAAAGGKCRCGCRGAGGENHKRCKALLLYRTNGEISPVERGSGSGNGREAIQGFASGGSVSSSSGRECSVPSGTGHFWPQRPANFSLLCLRRPHFFQQRKKWGKERRQKPMVFGFPLGRM